MNETQIDIVGILRFSALLLTCHDDDVRVIPLSVTSFLARASPIKNLLTILEILTTRKYYMQLTSDNSLSRSEQKRHSLSQETAGLYGLKLKKKKVFCQTLNTEKISRAYQS